MVEMQPNKIKITSLGICMTILVISAMIPGVAASEEHYSGTGWTLILYEDPIINPQTGNPYESMGDFYQATNPAYWESLSMIDQNRLSREPAVLPGLTLAISRTEEQQAMAMDLAGQTMTKAEYYAHVFPDLFALVPEWQKEIWENTRGIVNSNGILDSPGHYTYREIVISDDGEVISGGMTEEELFIADLDCPFNIDSDIPDSSTSVPESLSIDGTDVFSRIKIEELNLMTDDSPLSSGFLTGRYSRTNLPVKVNSGFLLEDRGSGYPETTSSSAESTKPTDIIAVRQDWEMRVSQFTTGETSTSTAESIAQAVQSSSTRSEIIAQAITGRYISPFLSSPSITIGPIIEPCGSISQLFAQKRY